MDLSQFTRDQLVELREQVENTLEERKRTKATNTASKQHGSAADAPGDFEALESNLKSELERFQQWMSRHR
jgi:hypothetical protein